MQLPQTASNFIGDVNDDRHEVHPAHGAMVDHIVEHLRADILKSALSARARGWSRTI